MKRLISIGEKVYDRDLMDKVHINDSQLQYLFEAEFGRPHQTILSRQDISVMRVRGMVSATGELMPHGHDILMGCEADVDCATCIHYRDDEGGERCALYDTIARCGEYCRDWEENL